MNLIHGVLFAVLTFMCSASLSAQSWHAPVVAIQEIQNTLNTIQNPTPPSTQTSIANPESIRPKKVANTPASKDVTLSNLKVAFLQQVLTQIKQGVATGDAVESVHAQFLQLSGNDFGDRQNQINTVYLYVVDLLS